MAAAVLLSSASSRAQTTLFFASLIPVARAASLDHAMPLPAAGGSNVLANPADSVRDELAMTTFVAPEALLWPDVFPSQEADLQIGHIDSGIASEQLPVFQSLTETVSPLVPGKLHTFTALALAPAPELWKMALIGLGTTALLFWRCRR
jgi:hypothetical protein